MEDRQRQTAETFDAYKDSYTGAVDDSISFSGLKTDFFVQVKADHILRLAAEHFSKTDHLRVIDIGCGVGNYHPLLGHHFGSIAGVDVSSACIETARTNNPNVAYQAYDGDRLPYDSGSFDLAYTICVMHHVPPEAWPGFAAEMKRVLKPGGLALVFEHNPLNPFTMRAVNSCPFDKDAVLLKKSKTEELLHNAGFNSVSSQFILTVPPRGAVLRAVDRLFSRLPLGAQYVVQAEH